MESDMIEHERSYVFTHEGAHKFLQEHGMSLYGGPNDSDPSVKMLKDCYLGKGMRVRRSWTESGALPPNATAINMRTHAKRTSGYNDEVSENSDVAYIFTQKQGDKAQGFRFEFEEEISKQLAEALVVDKKLCVKKIRKKLPVANDAYLVTMDFVYEPMKLAVLEIEACSEVAFPVPVDITKKLFNTDLTECPLCTYTMFNRHIGIAGAPSSGKTETAKMLSHVINTEYGGNCFHVAEFATTFIQKYKKNPSFWEEFFIWHGQHEREHSADSANIIVSDCPTFLPYIYLMHLPKDKFSESTALVLAKMYKRVLFDIDWYSDLILLRLRDYKENHIRYQSKEEALVIETRIQQFLDDHNISYLTYDYTQKDDMLKDLFHINS